MLMKRFEFDVSSPSYFSQFNWIYYELIVAVPPAVAGIELRGIGDLHGNVVLFEFG